MGLEPTTPCLQSRCSSQLSYVPEAFTVVRLHLPFSPNRSPHRQRCDSVVPIATQPEAPLICGRPRHHHLPRDTEVPRDGALCCRSVRVELPRGVVSARVSESDRCIGRLAFLWSILVLAILLRQSHAPTRLHSTMLWQVPNNNSQPTHTRILRKSCTTPLQLCDSHRMLSS